MALFVDNEDRAALMLGPSNDYDHRRLMGLQASPSQAVPVTTRANRAELGRTAAAADADIDVLVVSLAARKGALIL
jgi:hypothetical protein